MIPKSQLQEFGFTDEGKFPRHLIQHSVSMSLPSAMDHGTQPLEVIVDDGLVVPLQKSSTSAGMIIRSDGTMLYVWHRDAKDPRSALEASFIKDIPYEARAEVNNIMHRAVLADPSLAGIWAKVSAAWIRWFPALEGEGSVLSAGEFSSVVKAWDMIGELLGQLLKKVPMPSSGDIRIKVIVESEDDFKKGWLGEENVVDEALLREVLALGRTKYLLARLFPTMQKALRSPVFHSGSSFRLYYGSSSVYMIKLVVVPPVGPARSGIDAAGIDFVLGSLDGFSPSLE